MSAAIPRPFGNAAPGFNPPKNTTTTSIMSTPNDPIAPILDAYRSGQQILLVSGRPLSDLHLAESGGIRPLLSTLSRQAWREFGMGTLLFNLAQGPRWSWEGVSDEERSAYEARLGRGEVPLLHGIRAAEQHRDNAFERAFLLLASVKRTIEHIEPMSPLLLIWEFGEDLVPDADRGSRLDWVVQFAELLQLLTTDYRRRRHPFLMVLAGAPERIDPRVVRTLHPVALPQPDRDEKLRFIAALRELEATSAATTEPGMDDQVMANLTALTPNTSLEEAFLASARTRKPVTHAILIEKKRADVVAMSEGTLSLMDTERVKRIRLAGRTIQKAMDLLAKLADGLRRGDPLTPINVILAGAPSTAKTDLALWTALRCMVPAYSVFSPKGSLVGQTERLARLLFRVLKELSPAFGFVDELTEAFPTERHSMNLDSGASAAVTAEMLSALSDSSRAGRTVLLATTNCPWRVGAAMASRFLYIPVLSAIVEDYPEILCAIAEGLFPNVDWDFEDQTIRDAARLFHQKGASPRVMRTLISSKISTTDEGATPSLLLRAAKACAPQDPRDRASAEYADLFAIRACSDLEMLPWFGRMTEYPLPTYLQGIIDENSGEPDPEALNRRLEELRPHVNV
jgi:hypothetical protein